MIESPKNKTPAHTTLQKKIKVKAEPVVVNEVPQQETVLTPAAETAESTQIQPEAEPVSAEVPEESSRHEEAAPVETRVAKKTGSYVVQIATYVAESDAKRVVAQMEEHQLPAFVKGVSRSGGRVFYTTYLGRFETYQEAQNSFAQFRKTDLAKTFQDSFIRRLKE